MIGDQLIYIHRYPNFFWTLQTYNGFRLETKSIWNRKHTFTKP